MKATNKGVIGLGHHPFRRHLPHTLDNEPSPVHSVFTGVHHTALTVTLTHTQHRNFISLALFPRKAEFVALQVCFLAANKLISPAKKEHSLTKLGCK